MRDRPPTPPWRALNAALIEASANEPRSAISNAIARVADSGTNAKLQVSFFSLLGWRPIWGDYWVLALGPDYEYAVVGEPGRQYGWILARTPTLPAATREAIDHQLRVHGYDPALFENSPHSADR